MRRTMLHLKLQRLSLKVDDMGTAEMVGIYVECITPSGLPCHSERDSMKSMLSEERIDFRKERAAIVKKSLIDFEIGPSHSG